MVYFVANGIMPNKKAYGVHLAKMCEAFLERGVSLTFVVPRTPFSKNSFEALYGLRQQIPTVFLPSFGGYHRGPFMFVLSSLSFMFTSTLYLWHERVRHGKGIIYTVDLSTFSYANLPLCGMPVYIEVHDRKPKTLLNSWFFKVVSGCIATNAETMQHLMSLFKVSQDRIIVEPNGVEGAWLEAAEAKTVARERLGIPLDEHIVLYLGRFYSWKGLEIIPEAAQQSTDFSWYVVGGTEEEFRKVVQKDIPSNVQVKGECRLEDVPLWLAAADALLITGTNTTTQSSHHTAPMKVFEYMALQRPVIAAATPALKSIVTERDVSFYEPDNASDLAATVRTVRTTDVSEKVAHAYQTAKMHTWSERAERIQAFIQP